MEIRLKVEQDMPKAQEIGIIRRLQEVFNENSDNYLHSFFSPTLCGWVENQIRDDMGCSLDEYLDGKVEFDHTKRIGALESELASQKALVKVIEEDSYEQKTRLEHRIEQLQIEGQKYRERAVDAESREESLDQELASCEIIIRDLKAEIYDLQKTCKNIQPNILIPRSRAGLGKGK
jgi:hypothetical protein